MMGMSMQEAKENLVQSEILIDPENWLSFKTWQAISTQWIYGAMGGVVGLNYPGVKTVLDLTVKPKARACVFEDIQIMERTALAILNEKAD
jgi:hypothetical protein